MNTGDKICAACEAHGAKAVYDAAHMRMNGDHEALPKVGLENGENLGDVHHVAEVAFRLFSPEERARDLTEVTIGLAKIG